MISSSSIYDCVMVDVDKTSSTILKHPPGHILLTSLAASVGRGSPLVHSRRKQAVSYKHRPIPKPNWSQARGTGLFDARLAAFHDFDSLPYHVASVEVGARRKYFWKCDGPCPMTERWIRPSIPISLREFSGSSLNSVIASDPQPLVKCALGWKG